MYSFTQYIYEFCYSVSGVPESYLEVPKISFKSSITVFLGCLRGNWRYLRFPLISVVNFYYVINKLIILASDSH
jgi:hypothetical protein